MTPKKTVCSVYVFYVHLKRHLGILHNNNNNNIGERRKNSLPCHLCHTEKTHAIWAGYKFSGRLVLRLLAKRTVAIGESSSVFFYDYLYFYFHGDDGLEEEIGRESTTAQSASVGATKE